MSNYRIVHEAAPSEADLSAAEAALVAYNHRHGGDEHIQRLCLFLRGGGEPGHVAGALLGEFYCGWLHVDILFVAEDLRGQGHVRALLRAGEAAAVAAGAHAVALDTFSFQALEFYLQEGYEEFGRLEDFPVGHRRHYLRKALAPASVA